MIYQNKLITGSFAILVTYLVNISSVKASVNVIKERLRLMRTIAKTNKLIRAVAEIGNNDLVAVNTQKLILAAQIYSVIP